MFLYLRVPEDNLGHTCEIHHKHPSLYPKLRMGYQLFKSDVIFQEERTIFIQIRGKNGEISQNT